MVCVHLLPQISELTESFLSKFNSIYIKIAVVSSCQAKFNNSSATRSLWNALESIPPDFVRVLLEILIKDEVLCLFRDEKLNVVKRNSISWCL